VGLHQVSKVEIDKSHAVIDKKVFFVNVNQLGDRVNKWVFDRETVLK